LPIKRGHKAPAISRWQMYCDVPPTQDIVTAWAREHKGCGIGLALGTSIGEDEYLVAVDIDDPELVDDVKHAMGGYVSAKRGKKGLTIFARTVGRMKNKKITNSDKRMAVELLSHGSQTVIPPTIHPDTNEPYFWVGEALLDVDLHKLPVLDQYVMDEIYCNIIDPENKLRELNTMTWAGVGGGGNTHEVSLQATALMVSREWPDHVIHRRVNYAKGQACERAGMPYDWPEAEKTIQEWIDSARRKGMTGSSKGATKISPEFKASMEFIAMMGGEGMVKGVHGEIRVYDSGYWKTWPREMIMNTMLQARLATGMNVLEQATKMVYVKSYDDKFFEYEDDDPGSDPFRNRICFSNGTLNMLTGELEEWNPEHRLIHKLDLDWDPMATCPAYDKFISDTFGGLSQHINLWEEFAGLTLVPDMSYQKLLILKGPGANGKSTALNLLISLHNRDAISSVNITALANERVRTQLAGKLVNISSEESKINTVADDYLKRITGGDPVQLRRLYGEPFDAKLQVRFINALNDLPAINDSSYAIERRMMILPTDNVVKNPDITLPFKLAEERPGVMVRLVKALQRLRARTRFDEPEVSKLEVMQYLTSQDSVKYWMQECKVEPDEEGTLSTDLYQSYATFCDMGNIRVAPMSAWGIKMKGMGYDVKIKRVHGKNARVRYLKVNQGGKSFDV
jgi:P4 family phage/plasmid primase-like protien